MHSSVRYLSKVLDDSHRELVFPANIQNRHAESCASAQHNMETIFTFITLVALASSAPLPASQRIEPLPLVSLALIGSPSHYTVDSAQSPQLSTFTSTSGNAWSIHIPIDVSLDLSTRPEHVQAIEVTGVGSGKNLAGEDVEKDDGGVLCKASLGWGSEEVVVRMGKGRVVVDGGKMGRVTGLSCWKAGA